MTVVTDSVENHNFHYLSSFVYWELLSLLLAISVNLRSNKKFVCHDEELRIAINSLEVKYPLNVNYLRFFYYMWYILTDFKIFFNFYENQRIK